MNGDDDPIEKIFKDLYNKISELRDQIKNIWDYLPSDLGEQLNELKELHTHQTENDQIIHVEIYEMINSNKEVLREFMDDVRFTLDKEIHPHSMDYLSARVQEHKEKLEGK